MCFLDQSSKLNGIMYCGVHYFSLVLFYSVCQCRYLFYGRQFSSGLIFFWMRLRHITIFNVGCRGTTKAKSRLTIVILYKKVDRLIELKANFFPKSCYLRIKDSAL